MLIGISKCDLLDDQLKREISNELPTDIPNLFFSSVSGEGLLELKDSLWKLLNK